MTLKLIIILRLLLLLFIIIRNTILLPFPFLLVFNGILSNKFKYVCCSDWPNPNQF